MAFAVYFFRALRGERAYILHIGQSINLKTDKNSFEGTPSKDQGIQFTWASLKYF